MEPVPVQDIDAHQGRAQRSRSCTGPELRTIFLGMDQKRDELLFSNVKGKNPFKDKRVRQAFYQAIDIDGIKRTVMRGASRPDAQMFPAQVNGFDRRPEQAPALRPRGVQEAAGRCRLPERLRGDDELPERPLRQRRADLPGGRREPGAHRRQDQSRGRNQGHLLSRRSCAATPASTCWAGRPSTSTRTTCCIRSCRLPGEGGAGQFNLGAYSNPKLDELTDKIAVGNRQEASATR